MIHPLFDKWFAIKATEYHAPRAGDELDCLTERAAKKIMPKSLTAVMTAMGKARIERARTGLADKSAEERRQIMRAEWSKLLGPIAPAKPAVVKATARDAQAVAGAKLERLVLEVEPGILVPLVVLAPRTRAKQTPVVIGLAQGGKAGFLKERSADLRKLLDAGVAVVLPDLRGTGETQSGTARGKDSSGTDHSVHVQLFGETLLGQRLRDLRSLMAYLRTRPDLDARRMALWGDSFAPTNFTKTNFKVPHGVDGWPMHAEPLGGLLGLLGALYEKDVRAVFVSGGLTSYHAVLTHFAVLVPHDACVPGALTAGDLCDLTGALAPRPLHLARMVDHLNRLVSADDLRTAYTPAIKGYSERPRALTFGDKQSSPAAWLVQHLR
jgi:hypothetical protein